MTTSGTLHARSDRVRGIVGAEEADAVAVPELGQDAAERGRASAIRGSFAGVVEPGDDLSRAVPDRRDRGPARLEATSTK